MGKGFVVATVTILTGLAAVPAQAVPVQHRQQAVKVGNKAVTVSVLKVDLHDPETVLTVAFPHDNPTPGEASEPFARMVSRARPAAAINGSFFSTSTFEVLGNIVTAGRLAQYRRWEDRGTAFTLGMDRQAGMTTLRAEGWPDYRNAWLSLACGPRLVRDGRPWLFPRAEGFQYANVFAVTGRSALGLSRDGRWLSLVVFRTPVSLEQEAEAMLALGAWQAMNLDGGASIGQAYRGRILATPGRALTNVLLVYDSQTPAPEVLQRALDQGWTDEAADTGTISDAAPPHYDPAAFR